MERGFKISLGEESYMYCVYTWRGWLVALSYARSLGYDRKMEFAIVIEFNFDWLVIVLLLLVVLSNEHHPFRQKTFFVMKTYGRIINSAC
jgi:hypothetical protein